MKAAPGGKNGAIDYTPDGQYIVDGMFVVYDVKPRGYVARIKRNDAPYNLRTRIFEAAHGVKITIVEK